MSRVALITGSGAPRIGADIAKQAAERGYSVALHYHTSQTSAEELCRELNLSGEKHAAFGADVSSEEDVQELFRRVSERFGRLDLLVTSAAIWEEKELFDVTADDVLRHFEVNTLGTFLCCRYAGEIMVKQAQGGVIITIGVC